MAVTAPAAGATRTEPETGTEAAARAEAERAAAHRMVALVVMKVIVHLPVPGSATTRRAVGETEPDGAG